MELARVWPANGGTWMRMLIICGTGITPAVETGRPGQNRFSLINYGNYGRPTIMACVLRAPLLFKCLRLGRSGSGMDADRTRAVVSG